jgi:hypothetical protein
MNDLIKRRDVLEDIEEDADRLRTVLDEMDLVGIEREKFGYGLGLLEALIDDVKQMPPVQPEVTEEAVKDYCRKRCLTILTNDYFHKLTSAQPEIIRCKDCKKYDMHDHRCKHWNHGVVVMDWCSKAERRTDG